MVSTFSPLLTDVAIPAILITGMGQIFKKLSDGFDFGACLLELESNKELWDQITARQKTNGSPHSKTETIFLRWSKDQSLDAVFNELEAVDYPAMDALPETRKLLDQFAEKYKPSKVGRVIVVNLHPQSSITPHLDDGHYADNYDRFHIPITSENDNFFYGAQSAMEVDFVHMAPGELWWFNNKKTHWVENRSNSPRIHLIIDAVVPGVGRLGKGEDARAVPIRELL